MSERAVSELVKKLGLSYNSSDRLLQSVTHTSYAHEHKSDGVRHNERLEFLGDAVLELAVSELLFLRYPELPEGELTKLRAGLVCEASLVEMSKRLGLGDYLRLGKGEEANGGRERPSILADAFEAVIGAIYLEMGFDHTSKLLIELLEDQFVKLEGDNPIKDYKTALQEKTQIKYCKFPEYEIVEELGPDHDKQFTAEIYIGREVISQGIGKSKKQAEQRAAKNALDKLN